MEEKAPDWHSGQTIWVSHRDVGYTKGTILDVLSDSNLNVRLDEFDELTEIDTNKTEVETTIIDTKTLLSTDDLTLLPDLHRPSLLEALRQRFLKDQIYTYTGHILIAINPFKSLNLYNQKIMQSYLNAFQKTDLKPHVYFTAKESFKNMKDVEGKNQSILVSGESGAGKTVTTKIVLDYLTTISDNKSIMSQKIIQSNPVLEAFGNAKTLRNDNSSRFGKLIQLSFSNKTLKVNSCKIDTYLLEKARVMNHAKGERNFHIFYELQDGLDQERLDELEYIHPEDSKITNAHNRRVRRGDITDKEQWEKTLKAMKTVGLSDDEIYLLQRVISAIMHLGELEFEDIPGNTDDAARITSETEENATIASKLLEIPYSQLQFSLCSRIITLGSGKTVTKVHNIEQAKEARNAISMALYERTFLWLVWKTNKGMRSETTTKTINRKIGKYMHSYTISVLDIFGFEVFKINTFEQLFINYANEVLQQLFNEFVFKIEQQVYESEGIDWKQITFPDNSLCISLVEDKKAGILKNLDDVCLMPKGTDSAFHNKVKTVCAKKFKAISVDNNRQTMQKLFTIQHFAGEVEYSADSFCLKNKNELRQEQINCLRSSENDIIKTLLPEDPSKASGAANASYFDQVGEDLEREKRRGNKKKRATRRGSKGTQKLQQATVGNNFRVELNFAIDKIKASQLHFIRCIKPNDESLSNEMDRKRTLEQLNYSGVLEAVRISRLGYSSRFFFKDFAQRFFLLQPNIKRLDSTKNNAYKGQCLDILELNNLSRMTDYQVGHSKVFLKAESFTLLESLMRQKQSKSILIIQRSVRCYLFRRIIANRVERTRQIRLENERKERERIEKERIRKEKAEQEKLKKAKEIERLRLLEEQRKEQEKVVHETKEKKKKQSLIDVDIDLVQVETSSTPTSEGTKRRTRKKSRARSRISKTSKDSHKTSRTVEVKIPRRHMNADEALGFALKDYFGKMVDKLKKADINSLLKGDLPFLIGCLCLFSLLVFNTSGVQLQTIVSFLFLFVSVLSAAIFVAQMKLESDRKRMERYEVKRRKKSKRKEVNDSLLLIDEDEIPSSYQDLRRRSSRHSRHSRQSGSSKRSRRSKSKSKSSKRRKSSSKKKNKRKSRTSKAKIEADAVEMSTSELMALNQKKRRIQSLHSLSKTQSKKFGGLLSKESMKEKPTGGLKKTNSRYGGLSYKFPDNKG